MDEEIDDLKRGEMGAGMGGLDARGFDKSGVETPHSKTLSRLPGRVSWGYRLIGGTYHLEKESQNHLTSIPTQLEEYG